MLGTIRRRIAQRQLLPYRWTHLGGLLNTLVLVHLRGPILRRRARREAACSPADITVIIGHRNRADYRLINALRSATTQRYSRGRVHVMVVDYGSDPVSLERLRRITGEMHVECVAVTGVGPWNRSHCVNVGLRRVRSRYLMVSDVDVILSPDYLEEAVSRLEAEPLGVVLAPCLHLPAETTLPVEEAATGRSRLDLDDLRSQGVVKTRDGYSTGVVVAPTGFLRLIRGFDEYYREYGAEDVDLVLRLRWLGLKLITLTTTGPAYYLHQWHERHEGVRNPGLRAVIAENARYLNRNHSIRRNPGGWGETPTGAGPVEALVAPDPAAGTRER